MLRTTLLICWNLFKRSTSACHIDLLLLHFTFVLSVLAWICLEKKREKRAFSVYLNINDANHLTEAEDDV